MKKLIFITLLYLVFSLNASADNSYFIDFNKILNGSKSGAQVQKNLQNKLKAETVKYKQLEKDIRKEESEIISKKKVLEAEEYKKKVQALRKKVADLQKNKQSAYNNLAKSRDDAKKTLIKAVKPIIKKYMEENNIRLVLDKKSVILGDTTLEITDQIITILNKELPSIKIN
jgi:Skp family chaperone for outer membrane proteins|tara:strand:- start:8 stop:523 length:516 start_codon:yes stop_codon:yes gene_type:complete